MSGRPTRCGDCDAGMFQGDGRCSRCHSSGTNLNLASDLPKCPACAGSGVCATCGGRGFIEPPQDEDSIQKLFVDRCTGCPYVTPLATALLAS